MRLCAYCLVTSANHPTELFPKMKCPETFGNKGSALVAYLEATLFAAINENLLLPPVLASHLEDEVVVPVYTSYSRVLVSGVGLVRDWEDGRALLY